ncbi:MAG: response regulator [Bacteroidetes bacterium]|nr:response regulator [Bacteroidota bacterium]
MNGTKNMNGLIRYIAVGIFAALLILLAGWWVMKFRSAEVDSRIRAEMLAQVTDLARTIDPDNIKALDFSATDSALPSYKRIRSQMRAFGRLIYQRGIYSMALKNDKIVFGPENYDDRDPMGAGAPGTVYENPTPNDFLIFNAGKPIVIGPNKDEYGTFISALAPVFDPVTEKVLMVVGIDILSDDWQKAIITSIILPGIYTVLTLLLLVTGLFLIRKRNKLPREKRFRLRYVETIYMAVTCALLSAYITILIHESALRERYYIFNQHASTQVEYIRGFHEKIRQEVQSLKKFFESDEEVDSIEFSKFLNAMAINPGVFTIAWAPRDDMGRFYVKFSSNHSDRTLTAGYDLTSNQTFQKLIEQSLQTSLSSGSEPQFIPGNTFGNATVFSFNPVFINESRKSGKLKDSIVGIIVGAVHLNLMVDSPMQNSGLNQPMIVTDLLDLNQAGNPALVATAPREHFKAENPDFTLQYIRNFTFSKMTPIFMFGRSYALFSHPSNVFYGKFPDKTSWISGIIGLFVTISFTFFVCFIRNQQYSLERVVSQRTAELSDRVKEMIVAKNQAEASDKLKTAFLNNISHEVRTPLNGILGFSGLLAQPDIPETDRTEFYALLKESSNRLMSTITSYMDMSLLVTGNMVVTRKYFIPAQVLELITEQHQHRCILKTLKLSIDISPEDQKLGIFSDRELFEKIFNALLDNAVKFTATGEIITGLKQIDKRIEFFVRDTGSGVTVEAQKRIFETFMQEELLHTRGYEGSGLGLSIASEALRLLGGDIRVESEKNSGSIFYFTLPLNVEPNQITDTPEPTCESVGKSDGIILIAEDDEANRLYFQTILKKSGYNIITVGNGELAVSVCRSNPAVSLVLMDLKMPVMDGFQATRIIKSLRSDLPVIAITAFAMTGDDRKAIESGCDDYLTKPINKDLLLKIISKYQSEPNG